MLTLDTPIEEISRVGKTAAKRLGLIDITTVEDLLFYFPFRYEDYRETSAIKDLAPGQHANIVGVIDLIQAKRSPRKRMHITEALISDGSETIKAVWFNQPYIAKTLRTGDRVSLAGKVEGDTGEVFMRAPAYEKLAAGAAVNTQGLVPIYHLTANLTQKQVRYLLSQVIVLADRIEDWLPAEIIKRQQLPTLAQAIRQIHFPKTPEEIEAARRRLAFNELFLLQLQSVMSKNELRSSRAWPVKFHKKETQDFVRSLPFTLTDAQKKAAWKIIEDIGKDRPMARLLEGDVGSGKTLVAVLAMLNTALNGQQSVLMVPTEILARQHYESILKFLGDKVPVCLLTRSQYSIPNNQHPINKKITKKTVIENINNGVMKIIIGTHALLQEDVCFKNLVLAVIDEQHRFGVDQRKALIEKSSVYDPQPTIDNHRSSTDTSNFPLLTSHFTPHLLSMTATPIPRTLALALYGDLDLTIINEMPKGRKPILTKVVPEYKRADAYKFIREQVKGGRQVFVICPLIDISDKLGVKSAKEEFEKLDKTVFPDLKIGLLHGRMKAKEKEAVMSDFFKNDMQILVSTSVVEVGVDVPNATIMMIEGADRFGLAQLHQFRGRVGRSEHQSYCFLFTDSSSAKTLERLEALATCHDGFQLAKIDLKFRGPGEVYGTAQKGFPDLKIATLFDYELMQNAREEAETFIKETENSQEWPKLLNDKIDKLHMTAQLS